MNPLMLSALMNIGGGALGGIFAGGAASKRQRQEQAWRKQLMALMNPSALMGRTNQFYQQFMQSPAFAGAARGAANRGNQLQNNLASSLGARGLSTTGIGAIAPSLARSSAAGQLGQVRTNAYGAAGGVAQNSLQDQIRALTEMGPQNSGGFGQAFGAQLGGGIGDFSNFLLNYQPGSKKQRYQTGAGTGGMWGDRP